MKTRFVIILTLGLGFFPVVSAADPDLVGPSLGIQNHADVPPEAIRCEFADRAAKDAAIRESAEPKGSKAYNANG